MVYRKRGIEKLPVEYIACCSFGKDSLATVLLALEHNEPLDEVLYCEVMFDDEISAEHPVHRDFIYNTAIPYLEARGVKVSVVRSKHNLANCFIKRNKRGKEDRRGKLWGFPLSGMCYLNTLGKIAPINSFLRNRNTIQYVGIAIDEPRRLARLKEKAHTISLLEKYQYTEEMAADLCKRHNLLSPIYSTISRGGCWFCPGATIKEFASFKKDYPQIWSKFEALYFDNKEDLTRTKLRYSDEFEEILERINTTNEKTNQANNKD